MKRSFYFFLLLSFTVNTTKVISQAFNTADYTKAAWMTCRFYGGQRSSTISKTPTNWLLLNHGVGYDFYSDADNGYSVAGGWSDCGDNVRFGQTQYYSAYMLLKGYDLWPNGYGDYYSQNYAGYNAAQDFTWEGGHHDPDGIPDILNEVKYATDYFILCTRNSTTFYYQVGDGSYDHTVWVTTVKKATEAISNGGCPRNVYKNPKDASMASFCGATLALMSRKYRQYDSVYADTCLAHALLAYAYAKAHPGTAGNADVNGSSFYGANAKWQDDYATMCTELYYATNDTSYKTEALSYAGNLSTYNYCFGYNNNDDIAAYNLATLGSSSAATLLDKFASGYKTDVDANGIYQGGNTSWGPLRYNANSAFIVAIDNLYHGITAVDPFIYKQIDFIMGNNSIKSQTVTSNLSFIVGFGTNTCQHPHHRNIYLDDNNVSNSTVLTIPTRNAQFGYLVGGVRSGSYDDTRSDYQVAEGGIDYSACLVGTLAYILAQTTPAPAGVTVSPTTVSIVVDSTSTVTATVAPTNATNKSVIWTSSNTSVATVNTSGVITAVGVGTCNVTATSTNNSTVTALVAVTVTMPTSIESFSLSSSNMNVYPMPFDKILTITAGSNMKSVSLLSISGAVISEQYANGQKEVQIQTDQLAKGVVLVKVVFEDNSTRIIKAVK